MHLFSSGEWQDISASGGGGGAARVGAPVAAVGACRPPQLKSTSLGFARSAHFALHAQAKQIFRTPIQEFAAEVFPEKDPSRAFITLRVDFVATRHDGSAVRLHPPKRKEAHIVASNLSDWRLGLDPVYKLDPQCPREVAT